MAKDKPSKPKRGAQLRQAYAMTRRVDPRVGLIVLAWGLGILVIAVVVGWPLHVLWVTLPLGIAAAMLVMTTVFVRRAERAAYSQIEGQPGAAASVLQSMRGKWTVTPAVSVNRNQDMVHRVVGSPGIVLVGEGQSARLTNLIANERKRLSRVAPDTPVYDLVAGNGEGQVPLRKLQSRVMKLPRNLRGREIEEVNNRLKAITANPLPIPKGPLPRNARMPRMPRGPQR